MHSIIIEFFFFVREKIEMYRNRYTLGAFLFQSLMQKHAVNSYAQNNNNKLINSGSEKKKSLNLNCCL